MKLAAAALIFACLASAALAAGAPFTSARTSTCLTSHQILVTHERASAVLPTGLTAVDGLSFSFALLGAQALDRGELFFSRNPAAAQALAKKLIAYSIEQAQGVQGIDQADAERRIRASVTIKGNAVVTWGVEHPKNASRRALAVCLR